MTPILKDRGPSKVTGTYTGKGGIVQTITLDQKFVATQAEAEALQMLEPGSTLSVYTQTGVDFQRNGDPRDLFMLNFPDGSDARVGFVLDGAYAYPAPSTTLISETGEYVMPGATLHWSPDINKPAPDPGGAPNVGWGPQSQTFSAGEKAILDVLKRHGWE